MTIKEIQEEIVDEFAMFDDWEDRFQYIIDLGKDLPLIDEKYKVEENTIKGCQSKVWLHAEIIDDKVVFTADSDAIITKGIIAILIRAFLLPKYSSATTRASSVLPTPVGPKKINEPIGRFSLPMPDRLRRIALATASTASF